MSAVYIPGYTDLSYGIDAIERGIDATGATDCTTLLQALLNECATRKLGYVLLPAGGQYRVNGNVIIPAGVGLIGGIGTALKGNNYFATDGRQTLLGGIPSQVNIYTDDSLQGAGNDPKTRAATFTFRNMAWMDGFTFVHPNQTLVAAVPRKYPYVVDMGGANCSVRNCTFHCSYLCIRIDGAFGGATNGAVPGGTVAGERCLIENITGMPLLNGISINNCFDTPRLNNIHFGPLAQFPSNGTSGMNVGGSTNVGDFRYNNCIDFDIHRCDLLYAQNMLSLGSNVGYHLSKTDTGVGATSLGPWAIFSQCSADLCKYPLLIDNLLDSMSSFIGGSFTTASGTPILTTGTSFAGHLTFVNVAFQPTGNLNLTDNPYDCVILKQSSGYVGISGDSRIASRGGTIGAGTNRANLIKQGTNGGIISVIDTSIADAYTLHLSSPAGQTAIIKNNRVKDAQLNLSYGGTQAGGTTTENFAGNHFNMALPN